MSETRDLAEPVEAARRAGAGASGLASLHADLTSSTKQPQKSQPVIVPRFRALGPHVSGNPKGKKAAKREFWRNVRHAGGSDAASMLIRRENRFDPRAARAPTVAHAVPSGVDAGWAALGQEFGFLPVWNDIAVIEHRSPTYVGALAKVEGASRKVARLRELLATKGIDDVTVVLAISKPKAEEIDLICDQDAHVVAVPETFWAQDAAGRVGTCRGLIAQPSGVDHLLPGITADEMRLCDRVDGQYSGRNPDLDEADVEEWRHRVFETARVA
ncbi:hypothetical protein HNR00_003256 [Methylorubrum rhodinum]|uniref:Uncharacterized protein n=1 Tax=Methylorubrum rhodinum TaxID=29428 RepID=A0A840ZMW9_9HYPH|nr:hypothetical protein [Methylorubrum rhodinum]MBB5758534.1 hypothetical protein [Methylorubrum rhodinum]